MSSDRAAAPDVVGAAEARALLHVNESRFYVLRARPDFPAGRELECGTVYDRRSVIAWNLSRKRRRPMARALQVYRETGTLAAAARAVDRDPTTIRAWLRELEEPLPRDSIRDPLRTTLQYIATAVPDDDDGERPLDALLDRIQDAARDALSH